MKEMFLNSLSTTIYKTISAAIKVGLILLITNLFGAENYGAYTFALSIFLFLNTIFRFGFDIQLQKKTVSICNDNIGSCGEFLAQKNLFKTIVIVASCLLFVSIILKIIFALNSFESLKFEYLNYIIFYSAFYAGMWLFAYYLRGKDKGKTSVFVLEIIFPVLNILLIILFKAFSVNPAFVLVHSYGLSVIITLIIFILTEKLNFNSHIKNKIFNQSIFYDIKSAFPFLLSSVSSMLMAWVDFFVISFFETDSQLGLYSVSTRLALFMLFPASAIAIFFSNKLIVFYKNNQITEIKKYIKKITLVLFLVSLFLFLFLNVFSTYILSLFGKEFIDGSLVLLFLTFGYMISASLGSFETVLLMSEYKKRLFQINLFVVLTNLFVNIPLVYFYGINGAAIGTLISIVFNRFLQFKIIKNKILFRNATIT